MFAVRLPSQGKALNRGLSLTGGRVPIGRFTLPLVLKMTPAYDPERYWDAKAKRSRENPEAAVRIGDPPLDRCIGRIQHYLIGEALRELEQHGPLDEMDVLDFGCGTGQWTTLLAAIGRSYRGTDISERMLDTARKLYPQFRFHKISGNQLPFPDNSFDLVSSIAVLHHNNYVDQACLVEEIKRVLRPNGWLISFEGLGERNTDTSKHDYYRTIVEWREFFIDQNLDAHWQTCCRYAVLWYAFERIEEKLGLVKSQSLWPYDTVRRSLRPGVLWLDRVFGPSLMQLTPTRIAGRQISLLRVRSTSA